MPNDFDRIEDERDLTAGLEYDSRNDDPDAGDLTNQYAGGRTYADDSDGYELDDPKHPDHRDVFFAWSDAA